MTLVCLDPSVNTLGDVYMSLRDDSVVKEFLENIRWGGQISCPFCGCKKYYSLRNRRHYRCGDRSCDLPFSVSTKSMISGMQIKYSNLVLAFFAYQKSGMSLATTDLSEIVGISFDNCYLLKRKVEFCYESVIGVEKPSDKFLSALRVLLTTDKPDDLKKKNLAQHYKFFGDMDISDAMVYNRLKLFVERKLNKSAFIYIEFASPEEILSESYINMADSNFDNKSDADFIIKTINRTISKMWYSFVISNPELHERMLATRRRSKKEGRILLKRWYLLSLERRRSWNKECFAKLSGDQMDDDSSYLLEVKERIIAFRKRVGSSAIEGFNPHYIDKGRRYTAKRVYSENDDVMSDLY